MLVLGIPNIVIVEVIHIRVELTTLVDVHVSHEEL